MISDETFERGIALLQKHFEWEIDPMILAVWRTYLNAELNDAEFMQAAMHTVLHVPFRFRTTAGELVAIVQGGKESVAIQEWRTVLDASGRSDAQERLCYLSDRGKVALHAIGGVYGLGRADEKERQRLEKQFISVHVQCSKRDARSLPPVTIQPPVEKMPEPEFAPCPAEIKERIWQQAAKLGVKIPGV